MTSYLQSLWFNFNLAKMKLLSLENCNMLNEKRALCLHCLPWANVTFKPSENLVVLHVLPRSCHQGSCLAASPQGPHKPAQQTTFFLAQGSGC